ncbi:histone acetyltransferase subunit NuA4-domain-containing protein [Parachaetomium inaequale]|uniref:Chromatin modification-related protein EAF6 n=1 Tax=Parachaetomium inaequale TaxID=2588326 RepID=A0AAN6PNJ8_9PEZI|nr:histone acetyltransferase subunit NuA4-domain-containing protein [Parachaetomium inaequale]
MAAENPGGAKSAGAGVNGTGGGAGGGTGDANTASSSAAGIPFYEKQRQYLKDLIAKKRALEKKLAATEDHIAAKESDYLEATPSGNIVIGFDNYVKGGASAAAAAQRRRTGLAADQNRVFSRSSVSYNPAAATDAQTPASTPGPTPLSSSFGGNGPSGAPTPTGSAAGGGRANTSKKSKKNTPAAAAAAEDSETDGGGREAKKARTSFGARK